MLTHIGVLVDPVFLTEPLVRARNSSAPARIFQRRPGCGSASRWSKSRRRPKATPAYLPGEHPFKGEFETKHHLPEFAARGGAETMYPEFKERVREWLLKNPRPPAKESDAARLSRTIRLAAVAAAVIAGAGAAATRAGAQQTQNFDAVQLDIQQVSGNVYMVVGAGGNTTVFTGPEGVMVVDTQFAPLSGKILDAIRKLSDQPIRGSSTRICTAITPAATKRSPRPGGPAPAATSLATSAPRQPTRRASSPTRKRSTGW